MDIDIKRWLSVISACVFGWMSGFIIYRTIMYSVILYSMTVPRIQPTVPFTQLQPPPQVSKHRLPQSSISHAVVRIIMPEDSSQSDGSPHFLPHNLISRPPRSYYL